MTVEKRLVEIRKEAGMTQAAFAKRFGLSSRAYASYELGERELPSTFVVKLHDGLSINPTWVLTGKGPKSSEFYSQIIADAVVAVRTFVMLKQLEVAPEHEAKLVVLLAEYFEGGGAVDAPLVQKMLETVT